MRGKKSVLAGLASLVISMNGCYSHSIKDAPKPFFRASTTHDTEWNNYVSDISETCEKNRKNRTKSLVGNESLFYNYLLWLNSLSGKEFNLQNFEIVPDDFFGSFAHSGFVGTFMLAEIYWNGKIKAKNKCVNLGIVSHSYGHFTDAFFSTSKYVAHRADAARMDAVANAFDFYSHLELIRNGNSILGLRTLMQFPGKIAKKRKTINEVVEKEDRYVAADCIIATLMNEKETLGKTWYFLATHNTEEVYEEVEKVAKNYSGFENALMRGYGKILDEENCAINKIEPLIAVKKNPALFSEKEMISQALKCVSSIF